MLCECGCGRITPKYDRSNGKYRKGQHARFIRGHHLKGRRHAARLNEREVRGIRKKLTDSRYTLRSIAGFYGVSKECIRDIQSGRTWKDVV
jgi:hypothetical protein